MIIRRYVDALYDPNSYKRHTRAFGGKHGAVIAGVTLRASDISRWCEDLIRDSATNSVLDPVCRTSDPALHAQRREVWSGPLLADKGRRTGHSHT